MTLRFLAAVLFAQLAASGQITSGTIFLDPDIVVPPTPQPIPASHPMERVTG